LGGKVGNLEIRRELVIMSEPKSTGTLPADGVTQGDIPWGRCKPHYIPVYAECPVVEASKMKENK
jgi:hypothetical protein